MPQYSCQFSVKVKQHGAWHAFQYPHALRGQTGDPVRGVDPQAVEALRAGPRLGKRIVMNRRTGARLAESMRDGKRIAAYEKPVFLAAAQAALGKDVMVTDETGHWRRFVATPSGARAFLAGVNGVRVVR